MDNRIVLFESLLCNVIMNPLLGENMLYLFIFTVSPCFSAFLFLLSFYIVAQTRSVKTLWRTAVLLVGSSVEEMFRMS